MEYTHIQMIFHAKALEMLTIAYQELQEINTESDLEEFRNTFTSNNLKQFQQQQHQQSKQQQGVNSPQKNSYENLFNDRLNRTSTNNNQESNSLGQRRSKSNENLKKTNSAATASTSSINNSQINRPANTSSSNKNFHSSAPHLNQDGQHHLSSRDRSFNRSQIDVEDLTDDSDAE